MRFLALALMLASCASAAVAPSVENPAQLVAGCWVNRTPTSTSFMRWRAGEGDVMQGDRSVFGASGLPTRTRYELSPRETAWQLCEATESGQTCWTVAQGEEGSLDGGRAFIDRYRDRLRVGVVRADGGDDLIFDGQREGCG